MCAVTTHTSLVRHFLWIHLELGAGVAISTRNLLPGAHPLCRLLWPHIYRSQYSNDMALRPQMMPKGDFVMMYSLTHKGMCDLYEKSHGKFDVGIFDPVRDAAARGVVGQGFRTPSLDNFTGIFEVLLAHTTAYIEAYYSSDAALTADDSVRAWIADLDANIPNGIPVKPDAMTRHEVARWIAVIIYTVSVEHELRGTFQWNYQLWTHQQPSRVYKSGQREPLDAYQRLVNSNMILNVHRTEMFEDFSYLALDQKRAELFGDFRRQLNELKDSMSGQPRQLSVLYPDMLNANMNA